MFSSASNLFSFLQDNKQAYKNVYDQLLLVSHRNLSSLIGILRAKEPKMYEVLQFIFPTCWFWYIIYSILCHTVKIWTTCNISIPPTTPVPNLDLRVRKRGQCWHSKFWKWTKSWYEMIYDQYDISSKAKKRGLASQVWTIFLCNLYWNISYFQCNATQYLFSLWERTVCQNKEKNKGVTFEFTGSF